MFLGPPPIRNDTCRRMPAPTQISINSLKERTVPLSFMPSRKIPSSFRSFSLPLQETQSRCVRHVTALRFFTLCTQQKVFSLKTTGSPSIHFSEAWSIFEILPVLGNFPCLYSFFSTVFRFNHLFPEFVLIFFIRCDMHRINSRINMLTMRLLFTMSGSG